MKRILTFAMIAAIGLATFSGCSKKSSSPSYNLHATIGSTTLNLTNVYAVPSGTALAITGNSGTSTTTSTPPYFSITIYNYTTPTTYTIDTTSTSINLNGTYAPDATLTDMKGSKSGSVTITSYSTSTVTGTFNFVMDDGTVVSGGSFTAKVL